MRQQRRGFTLVEMMVVIGVVGVLTAISLPAFSRYVRSNRLATSASRLAADFQYARSLAIANGRVIRVALTTDGYTLTDLTTGNTIADRTFASGCTVARTGSVRFFPWGQAEANSFSVANCTGATMTVTVMPTGSVEVD